MKTRVGFLAPGFRFAGIIQQNAGVWRCQTRTLASSRCWSGSVAGASRFRRAAKFVELSANPHKRIRSESVQFAIGLATISAKYEKVPALLSADQEQSLRNALRRGLTTKVTRLVESYFSRTAVPSPLHSGIRPGVVPRP